MHIIAFLRQGDDALELADIVLHRCDTVMRAASDLGILLTAKSLLDDQRSMGDRAPHVFDRRSQRQYDPIVPQHFKVSGERPLSAVEQPVGQVLEGKEPALWKASTAMRCIR